MKARRAKTWRSRGLVHDSRAPADTARFAIKQRYTKAFSGRGAQFSFAIDAICLLLCGTATTLLEHAVLILPWPSHRSIEAFVVYRARATPLLLNVAEMRSCFHRPAKRYVP